MNSALACIRIPSPNNSGARRHAIDTVTIHCMAGNMTIESCGKLFSSAAYGASSNYGIGSDGRIAVYVDEDKRSWASNNTENDDRAVTIEVANTQSKPPYPVSKKAYAALIELLADICRRNNIKRLLWSGDKSLIGQTDRQNMTVHRWFAAKSCPGDWLYDRHGDIAQAVNDILEDEQMDVNRFRELWQEMRRGLQDNDASEYSEQARKWATDTGLITGGAAAPDGSPNYMWEDVLTREQLVTVLYRFMQMITK